MRSHSYHKYAVGEKVFISTENMRGTHKVTAKWLGPFPITEVLHEANAVKVDLTGAGLHHRLSRVWHVQYIKLQAAHSHEPTETVPTEDQPAQSPAPRVQAPTAGPASVTVPVRLAPQLDATPSARRASTVVPAPAGTRVVAQRNRWENHQPEFEIEFTDIHGVVVRQWVRGRWAMHACPAAVETYQREARARRATARERAPADGGRGRGADGS